MEPGQGLGLAVVGLGIGACGVRLVWEWWTGHVRNPLRTPPGPPIEVRWDWTSLREALGGPPREEPATGEDVLRLEPERRARERRA